MSSSPWGARPFPAAPDDQQRFGVRCPRCARTQPPTTGTSYACVYCGTPLPVRRWIAHPPPGSGIPRRVRLVRRPYTGPPRYGGTHPHWGFPPVIWRSATLAETETPPARVPALIPLAVLAGVTTLACLVAAGAELLRFVVLLRGRTAVLDGSMVHASDVLVTVAGTCALVLGVVTALSSLPTLVGLHRAVPERRGLRPSRNAAAVLARLVVPGWNLYGAGQVLAEIAGGLRAVDPRRRAGRALVAWWWLSWVANGLLVVATLIMAFGRSNQSMADTVELHVAVDLVGAVVAGLFAAVLIAFDRAWHRRGADRFAGWVVAQPPSVARNRGPAVPQEDVPAADSEGGDETGGAERGAVVPASPEADGDGAGVAGDEVGVTDSDPVGQDGDEVDGGEPDTGDEVDGGEPDTGDDSVPDSADPGSDPGQHRGRQQRRN